MRTWRRALWWIPALVLVAALSGCAAVVSTLGALNSDGFASPSVNINADPDGTTVTVGAAGHRTLPDDAAVDRAAEIVWRTTEVRLDRVDATVGGRRAEYDRARLTAMFGPRDPNLDATTVGSTVVSALIWVAVALLAVVIAVVVLIVVLVRRSRRRRSAAPPRPPPAPSPPTGPAGSPSSATAGGC